MFLVHDMCTSLASSYSPKTLMSRLRVLGVKHVHTSNSAFNVDHQVSFNPISNVHSQSFKISTSTIWVFLICSYRALWCEFLVYNHMRDDVWLGLLDGLLWSSFTWIPSSRMMAPIYLNLIPPIILKLPLCIKSDGSWEVPCWLTSSN